MQKNSLIVFLTLLTLTIWCNNAKAQELKAEVTVSTPKLQTTDPTVFKTLEKDLRDFLNQERRTKDDYKP